MEEEGCNGVNKSRVKYVQFDMDNGNCVESDNEGAGSSVIFDDKRNINADIGPENLCKSSKLSFNVEEEAEKTTTHRSKKECIKCNTKCKLGIALIVVAVVLTLFIALFVTVNVFGIKIHDLQSEQEATEGKLKLYRKLNLQSSDNQSELFNTVIRNLKEEVRINVTHDFEDIREKVTEIGNQFVDLETGIHKNRTTIIANVHHIIDDVANLQNAKDEMSKRLEEVIEKLKKEISINMSHYAKDIGYNLTGFKDEVTRITSDISKNITNIASNVSHITDVMSDLRNETDQEFKTLNEMIELLKQGFHSNLTYYSQGVRDDLLEIGNKIADIEDDVNTLMNKTGVISTDLKQMPFVISQEKNIKFAQLFQSLSSSTSWCMGDCLQNAKCTSLSFDPVSGQCTGFSSNCTTKTTYLSYNSKYYKKKGVDLCGEDWVDLCGNCYYFSNFKTDWVNASKYCQGLNSYLAVITSSDEHSNLASFGRKNYVSGTDGYWLDGSDEKEEGKWIWNSTGDALSYTNWYPGEPNNQEPEHCLEMNKHLSLKWNDSPCDKKTSQFICEKKINDI